MAEASEPPCTTGCAQGLRRPHNWMQLVKFCAVGGSGYVVNLSVFALAVACSTSTTWWRPRSRSWSR